MDRLEPGTKVIIQLGFEHELNGTEATVKEFEEDSCGEGCCSGYVLEEHEYSIFWPSQIKEKK